jgi:hypothetical protein
MERRLTPFEEWIRRQLEDLEAPASESNWDLFQQRLEEEGGDPSDEFLAATLGGLDAGLPADWSLFEKRLDESSGMPTEEEAFDDAWRASLQSLEGTFQPDHWLAMEAALDEEDDPATPVFDKQASQKLDQLEPAFQPQHWEQMARRLDDVFSIRRIVYRYKIIEAAVFLLFLLTVIHFWPGNSITPSSQREPLHSTQESPSTVPSASASTDPGPATLTAEEVFSTPIASNETDETASSQEQGDGSQLLTISGGEDSPTLTNEVGLPVSTVLPLPPANFQVAAGLPVISMERPQELLPLETITPKLPLGVPSQAATALTIPGQGAISAWRIGVLGSMDYNLILTPRDKILGTPSYSVDSMNYSAGLTLGRSFGKWEIETGALYSLKAYRPRVPILQYGTFDYLVVENFTGIQLHLVQAPLSIRYHVLPANHNWNVYGQAGVIANMLIRPNYEIVVEEVYTSSAAAPPPSREEREEVLDQSKLNQKSFPVGIAEGGRFLANTYLTGQLGIGLEKRLFGNSFLYLQSTYQRPLTNIGFGPNRDRINSMSFQGGVRYAIPVRK